MGRDEAADRRRGDVSLRHPRLAPARIGLAVVTAFRPRPHHRIAVQRSLAGRPDDIEASSPRDDPPSLVIAELRIVTAVGGRGPAGERSRRSTGRLRRARPARPPGRSTTPGRASSGRESPVVRRPGGARAGVVPSGAVRPGAERRDRPVRVPEPRAERPPRPSGPREERPCALELAEMRQPGARGERPADPGAARQGAEEDEVLVRPGPVRVATAAPRNQAWQAMFCRSTSTKPRSRVRASTHSLCSMATVAPRQARRAIDTPWPARISFAPSPTDRWLSAAARRASTPRSGRAVVMRMAPSARGTQARIAGEPSRPRRSARTSARSHGRDRRASSQPDRARRGLGRHAPAAHGAPGIPEGSTRRGSPSRRPAPRQGVPAGAPRWPGERPR